MVEIVEARVDELVLNGQAPRTMRPERWKHSLKTLARPCKRGLMEVARPVIVRRSDRVVIGGTMRVLKRSFEIDPRRCDLVRQRREVFNHGR